MSRRALWVVAESLWSQRAPKSTEAQKGWKWPKSDSKVTLADRPPSDPKVTRKWLRTPHELHAALRQMSLGKAAGEDEVTAELLKFGGDNLSEVVVRVCREQWMLLTEAAPHFWVIFESLLGHFNPFWVSVDLGARWLPNCKFDGPIRADHFRVRQKRSASSKSKTGIGGVKTYRTLEGGTVYGGKNGVDLSFSPCFAC